MALANTGCETRRMRLRLLSFLGCVAVAAAALATVGSPAASGDPLARPSDPVVLTGAQLPTLANGPRGTIVGFRWSGSAWVGVPIQVDERAVVNFGKIYRVTRANFDLLRKRVLHAA